MKVYVVSPYYGRDNWGKPEAAFTSPEEAEDYRSMGDMEVTPLKLRKRKRKKQEVKPE